MRGAALVVLALFAGCDCGGVDVGEQTITTKAVGLWLTSNPLEAPPGSLSEATNAAIRRNNIVEPRRGQKPDAPTNNNADSMVSFEGTLVWHTTPDDILQRRIDDTTVANYNDDAPFVPPSGSPMRFVESAGGLYATTEEGPYRLDSPTSDFEFAGVPPGLEGEAATTGASGWLADGSTVGYRVVWGRRDGDGALLLGAPSGRFLVTNSSGGTRDVNVTSPLPDGITATVHFLQIYRTVNTTTGGADPGEDMALVSEYFPTSTDITAGTLTVLDIAPYANGAAAYYGPSQGVGLSGSKLQPPLATDLSEFNGYLFGVVQSYRQTLLLTLLAVGAPSGIVNGDGIRLYDGLTDDVGEGFVGGATEIPGSNQFQVFTAGTAAENIENTARSLIRVLNFSSTLIYAAYASGLDELPGKMVLVSRAVGGLPIRIESSGRAINEQSPWVPALLQPFAGDVVRAANVATVTMLSSAGLAAGMAVRAYIRSADANFPEVTGTIASVPTGASITFANTGADDSALSLQFAFNNIDDVLFAQEATPASFCFSDYQEPDAWPPRFRFQCPGPNTTLYRVLPQGNALLFFTSAGLYRMSGKTADEFALLPMDPTVKLVGQNTPVALGNRVFALTDQGVVSISDLGVEKISEPIDQVLLPYYSGTEANKTLLEAAAFGMAYESENEYWLFLPELDGAEGSPATQAYVYNMQTGTWVGPWEFDWSGESGLYSATVNAADGRVYIATADMLTRERKDRALSDYQDATGVGILVDVATVVNTSKNPAAYKQWTEVTALLEQPQPAACEMYFTTELDSTEEGGTLTTQGAAALRTYVPLDKSRSARLTVGIRHSTAGEKLTILGYSTVANVVSTKVSR